MDAPPVQYVKTSDGYDLAFFDVGQGLPIIYVPSRLNSLTRTWSRFGRWVQPLAARHRLIHYDARGQGLSTRGLEPDISIADFLRDLETIIDHLKLDKVVLFSHGFGGHLSIRFALAHPERVAGLLLAAVTIEMKAWTSGLWRDVASQNWDFFLHSLVPSHIPEDRKAAYAASLGECETQADYAKMDALVWNSDLRDELPRLRVPILVMHPRNFLMIPAQEGPNLAAAIPGARLAMLGGDDGEFFGDPAEFVAAVEGFLARPVVVPAPEPGLLSGLSTRELEVLRLLAAGSSNQQIADELVISVNTVNRHVSNVYAKTGAANRAEAATYAAHHGIA